MNYTDLQTAGPTESNSAREQNLLRPTAVTVSLVDERGPH